MKCYQYFSEQDFQLIEKAIQHAESKSRGEIVMMVVKKSATFWEHYLLRAIFFIIMGTGIALLENRWLGFSEESIPMWEWPLAMLVIGLTLTSFSMVSRHLISSRQLEKKVYSKALREFTAQGLTKTKEATGILIFVSEFERRVQILADSGINKKVPPGTWDIQVKEMVQGIKAKAAGQAVAKAINEMGDLLAQHFPTTGENPNELPNRIDS